LKISLCKIVEDNKLKKIENENVVSQLIVWEAKSLKELKIEYIKVLD
jgi:hypothetical protein